MRYRDSDPPRRVPVIKLAQPYPFRGDKASGLARGPKFMLLGRLVHYILASEIGGILTQWVGVDPCFLRGAASKSTAHFFCSHGYWGFVGSRHLGIGLDYSTVLLGGEMCVYVFLVQVSAGGEVKGMTIDPNGGIVPSANSPICQLI